MQIAFWKLDDVGAVIKYDAWIPNLNDWVTAITNVSFTNPYAQQGAIEQLCVETQLRCTGANQQWDSTPQCIGNLTAKPFGDYDEAWGDNIVCRSIHIVLTQVRPDVCASRPACSCPRVVRVANNTKQVHCPHVGPTGGGKCVNTPYPDDYFSDQTLFGDAVGKTFTCNE